jgi:ATP-dependent DNA ligase
MLCRVRNLRGRPKNAPAAFIQPYRPTVSQLPPRGPGWAHELKHHGYRLQIHVRDGRVRLYTIDGADCTARYPLIVKEAARIKGSAIIDAEVGCAGPAAKRYDRTPSFNLVAIDATVFNRSGRKSCSRF